MLDRVLDALTGLLPPDHHDAQFLADVLWLAAACGPVDGGDAPGDMPDAPGAPQEPDPAGPPPDRPRRPARPKGGFPTGGRPPRDGDGPGAYGVYEDLHDADAARRDGAMAVAAGRALPQTVELARSLRPFMRRFPHGRRSGLDIAATVDTFSRGGELMPVIGPLPEPWFDVVVVTDTHLSMEMWSDAVEEFTSLLENSGAFRQVHRWRMSTEPYPYVTDARGRLVRSHQVPAPDGRRIVLVVSDCVAPAWYGPKVWQMLRSWAGHASLSVANPLPPRLWHRTALDLPAVRVRNRLPGERNTALAVTVPPHLRSVLPDTAGCVAIPTLTLTAHSLSRWARGLVRGAPEGYEAVLVTPFGAPRPLFAGDEDPGPAAADDAPAARGPLTESAGDGGGAPVRAFLRTASRPAVRLAALCSPFQRLSLPLIRLIRQEVVPEATVSDVAELLMSGMLQIRTGPGDVQVITFRDGARAPLGEFAGRHDAWQVLDALSRHIAQHTRLPGKGMNAFAALETDELPASLRPFAYATADVVAALRAGAGPDRPPAPGAGAAVRGGYNGGPDDAGEGPWLAMPDPMRSAALIVQYAPEPGDGSDDLPDGLAEAVTGVHRLVCSPQGWRLPPERVVWTYARSSDSARATLLEYVRPTLDRIAEPGLDALLVHVCGSATSLARDLLADGPQADHLVVIEDLWAEVPDERPALDVLGRLSTTWITAYHPAVPRPLLTAELLRVAEEGAEDLPPLLSADAMVDVGHSLSGEVRTRTIHEDALPALVHNAAAREPGSGPLDPVVERVLDRLHDELDLDAWPEDAEAAAERVLGALLRLAADWLRDPSDAVRELTDGWARTFVWMRLTSVLAPRLLTAERGPDFTLYVRAAENAVLWVPVQVLDFSGGRLWDRQQAVPEDHPPAWQPGEEHPPFVVLLVLGCRPDRDRTALAQHVAVTRDPALGSCVVTLRLPMDLPDPLAESPAGRRAAATADEEPEPGREPEPDQDPQLRAAIQAVEAYCADVNRRVDEGLHLSELSSLTRIRAASGMDDPAIVAVRPDPATVRWVPTPGAGVRNEVHARVVVALVGMLPVLDLHRAPAAVVLAQEGEFAFVSAELTLDLVFTWHPEWPTAVSLLRVRLPEDPEARP